MVTSIIPEDIIATEILTRLPSKSLLRFRSVCRTWNKLISDPLFVTQHFDRSVEREAMHITLVFGTSPPTIYSIDPENLDTTVPDDINAYPPPFTSSLYAIGACDGLLVCARVGLETVSVWHASTRTSMTFRYAALPGHPSAYGFFYDSTSRDYKLVSVTYSKERHSSEAIVHSADYTECRRIGSIPYMMINNLAGVVVNGSVHWLAFTCSQDQSSREEVIFALNPTCQELEEMSKVIPMPTNTKAGLGCVSLAQLGGSLSIVFTYSKRTEIWLMKEYGVESWSMYFRIPTDNLYFLTRPLRVVPLYITKKGDLILQINSKKLFMFDKKIKGLKSISIKYPQPGLGDDRTFRAITLLDSLVDIRNGHGGGKPFLGRQIERGKKCKENQNMGSDFANNTLILDNLFNIRNGHGVGKLFLGRQIKRESNLYNCTGKRTIESMGSDYANDSTDPETQQMEDRVTREGGKSSGEAKDPMQFLTSSTPEDSVATSPKGEAEDKS